MQPYLLKEAKEIWDTTDYKNLDFKYNALKYMDEETVSLPYKTILIFTRKEDADIDVLGPQLIKEGMNYIRVDSNDLRDFSFSINLSSVSPQVFIRSGGEKYNLNEIPVIIYRHFDASAITYPEDLNSENYMQSQWSELPSILEDFYHGTWINKPSDSMKNRKTYQLLLSRKVGFKTLDSWVTNDPGLIKQQNNLYTKVLTHHFVESMPNKRIKIYGKHVDANVNENEILLAPALYQKYLRHVYEVRVVVFDNKFWGIKYESGYFVDVHEKSMDTIKPQEIDIPNNIKEKILKLLQLLNLKFAALDFMLTDVDWIFLEVNATGDWGWLETRTKSNITQSYVDYLKRLMNCKDENVKR
ncbi:hypothetical protein [Ligilactobacillus acidipiscis]|uniref:ATP-grasp domain-containing protein n=1 Tax=Ligilactobacillus acidipiscis TaxID=89059 RepID=A0A0R2JWW9_9LACO|nr:hypothetical protein [Ligilactobacillus acidipiscis]KRN81608.1 hypothetical protein IV43_GL001842 [Ligilactobacillus acidipiscis]